MRVKVIDPNTTDSAQRELLEMVYGFAQTARLPERPQVGIYDSPEVNAFATGPTKSARCVAVSTGMLRTMNRDQIEGVVAHEVAHIANGDMVTMTLIRGSLTRSLCSSPAFWLSPFRRRCVRVMIAAAAT